MENPFANETLAREERPVPLFGPARPEELHVAPWEWRREGARALLLGVEGAWLLAWALFWIRASGSEPFTRAGVLVGGWFLLALVALASGHLAMRLEASWGWEGSRLLLAATIVVSTTLWWAAVSGGLLAFFGDIGALFRLQPGPGFWAFWLAILAWWRGLEWSQRLTGPRGARTTLHGGLFTLGLLSLLAGPGRAGATLPALVGLWLCGLLALGISRLLLEEGRLGTRRRARSTLKPLLLLAGAALLTLGSGALLLGALAIERRMALRGWLWEQLEWPLSQLFLLLVTLAVLLVTVLWRIFYGIVTRIGNQFGLRFIEESLPEQPLPAGEDALDAIFALLLSLPPDFWFVVKLSVFCTGFLFVLLFLVTRLHRGRYRTAQLRMEQAPISERGTLWQALASLPRPRWPRRTAPPEPADVVRRVYVRMVRLGEERGVPWHPQNTPFEHEQALGRAMVAYRADIQLITDWYVRVRYASDLLTPDDLRAVEAAWQRMRDGAA